MPILPLAKYSILRSLLIINVLGLLTLFRLPFVHSCSAQSLEYDETKIEYRTYGKADTTLLFIHGWAIDQSYWNNQVDFFDDNYQVVTLDLAGHGLSESSREDWTMESYGNDVVAVINELSLANVLIIGHSMGGSIMLEAASQIPERIIGLIGVDNFKEVGQEPSAEEKEQILMVVGMMQTNFSEVVDSYVRNSLFTPNSDSLLIDSIAQDMNNANKAMAISSLENLFTYTNREAELLQTIPVKLFLIQSESTPTNKKGLKKFAPHSFEIHTVGDVSHYPMVEVPEEFNTALTKIISSL